MEHSHDMEAHGPFDARYLAFLETITQLRPRLHRYCSRMTGSVMDGEVWTSTTTAVRLVRGCSGLRTIDASTSCVGVVSALRRKRLPWVQIPLCRPLLQSSVSVEQWNN
jgi:hypothetical protein